ncbi:MAG: hypothetical protein A3J75_04825 [Acidobacteria bacterium RBG_16_68_9]|nr:MAG: hypothetical protein A3J75_04825 [Acidobacteria bacterium RBG_16_68_9]
MLIIAHALSEMWCWFAGDAARALQHAHRASKLAEAATRGAASILASAALGHALLFNKRWSDAAAVLEQALAAMHERQVGSHLEAFFLADLAHAVAALGDFGRARVLADEAVSVAQQRRIAEVIPLLARAHVLRLSDGALAAAAIEADLQQAMAEVERTDARAYAPLIHVERAELAELLGDEAAYQRELREAHRLFTAMGATGHVRRIESVID